MKEPNIKLTVADGTLSLSLTVEQLMTFSTYWIDSTHDGWRIYQDPLKGGRRVATTLPHEATALQLFTAVLADMESGGDDE